MYSNDLTGQVFGRLTVIKKKFLVLLIKKALEHIGNVYAHVEIQKYFLDEVLFKKVFKLVVVFLE